MIAGKIKKRESFKVNDSTEGETIEMKIERVLNNGEPIEDTAPIIWTERKEGVRPEYDIRTDRFDIAIDAMDKVSKSRVAKREARHEKREAAKKAKNDGISTGVETTQGTDVNN